MLHDTVGIIFQNIDDNVVDTTESFDSDFHSIFEFWDDSNKPKSKKRRRTLDAVIFDTEPYLKKPKLHETLLSPAVPQRVISPYSMKSMTDVRFLWMLSHYLQ